ncbi:MAG: hypothetical protein EZS28_014407 [Streblomastix strix]|uniref:EGF-like domain-containing protein n=1 Tax=Streblomastix strix TaxID=222440 RepID=A0A5J4W5Z6_9EUKA|nr:MAG: hypothetical protein EZS28_014407 [Streblomastix strix]
MINKTSPVTIKGGVYQTGNQMRTIWRVNTSSTNTVALKQGILTLKNIQFEYQKESNSIIYPTGNFLEANYFTHNEQLIITQCIFKGLNNISVSQIIQADGLNQMNIIDCYFQDIQIENDFDSTVKFYSLNTGSEVLFENSHFENITQTGSYSMGIIDTTAFTDNQKVTINRCTFERCSLSQDQKQGIMGAISIADGIRSQNYTNSFIITNNKFVDNAGLITGGWNNTNIQSKIIQLFSGSTTTLGNTVYFKMSIDYIETQSGYANIAQKEICESKADQTSDCVCDSSYTTSYTLKTCQMDKLCKFDLIHQTTTDCPCLSSADPRAGIICPAYCVKGNLTSECVCDTNSSTYSSSVCEIDKKCKFDLINQSKSDCTCLSTADPRAGGKCPAYCTAKDQPTTDCICDSNSTSYPQSKCQSEKKCTTSSNSTVPTNSCECTGTNSPSGCKCPTDPTLLVGIPNSRCECRSTADPRAGRGQCPAYCIKGSLTPDCICDSDFAGYSFNQCQKDKSCQYDLKNQNKSYCPCLNTSDPRAGGECPAYCVKGQTTSNCTCDANITNFSVAQCEIEKKCITELVHQTASDCPCLSTEDPRAGNGVCPAYCTGPDIPTSDCVCDSNSTSYTPSECQSNKKCTAGSNSTVANNSCTCSKSNYPSGCKCPNDSSQLVGIPKDRCSCRSSSDPIAGSICPAYCISKVDLTANCVCDTGSTSYLLEICLMNKLCKFDLIHQTTTDCPCLSSADPRAGITCPSYCVKGNLTSECVCDSNSSSYSSSICVIDKKCKFDLINQSKSDCPCLNTGDPRAGGKCPDYCTTKDSPTTDCICDSNSTSYPQSTCNTEKGHCSASSNSTVTKDSCECTGTNSPSGCMCPTDPTQLIGIPSSRCECRSTADPRAGRGECPAYCVKGSLTPDCTCDIGSQSYPSATCLKDKLCIFELISQSKANCPCLMKGDPRAGKVCPFYCTSKVELTAECMCELGSSYPQATCERDKLCIVDLIHQSISNCPCLANNDPRDESICNQTEQLYPDPSDPIIPDPTETNPETDQEQEGGSKQESDKDETIKEEQKTSNFVWIIIVVVGTKKQEEID